MFPPLFPHLFGIMPGEPWCIRGGADLDPDQSPPPLMLPRHNFEEMKKKGDLAVNHFDETGSVRGAGPHPRRNGPPPPSALCRGAHGPKKESPPFCNPIKYEAPEYKAPRGVSDFSSDLNLSLLQEFDSS